MTYPEGRFTPPEVADSHTVDIDEKMLAEAYYIRKDGETIYNVYNLLGGKDDWDPLGNGEVIRFAGKQIFLHSFSWSQRLLNWKQADLP